MIEEELRATFARHEELAPAVGPLRAAIDRSPPAGDAAAWRSVRPARRWPYWPWSRYRCWAVPWPGSEPGADRAPVGGTPGGPVAPDTALNFLLLGVEGQAGTPSGPIRC